MAKRIIQDKTVKFFIVVMGLVFIAVILKELQNIFIPLVIAYLLFFLFNPLNNFCERKKIPLALTVFLDVIILAILAWGISYFLIDSFGQFSSEFPVYAGKLKQDRKRHSHLLRYSRSVFQKLLHSETLNNYDYSLLAGNIFNSTFSMLGNVFFILFFFIFIVTGHNSTYESIKKRYVYQKVKTGIKKN